MAKAAVMAPGVTRRPTRQMWRRSLVMLAVLALIFVLVAGRLVVLQVFQTDDLQQRAITQQLSDTRTTPHRGTIYDRKMNTLVESQQVWTVIMAPANIGDEAQRVKIANELSVLLEIDRDKLYERTGKVKSQYEEIRKKAERGMVDALNAWVEQNKMGGIFHVVPDYKRVYPGHDLAAAVLGFTGTDGNGLYGLEAQYESVLAGQAGRVVSAQNGTGRELPNSLSYEKIIDAKNGNDLVLTLDQTIQHYCENNLNIALQDSMATNRALAIVMDIKTGGILAMATKGDYDPNDPFTVADAQERERIAAIVDENARKEATVAAQQKQWNNKAVNDFYEPGSVFKIFTASMALEEGVVNPVSDRFVCQAFPLAGSKPMQCHVYPKRSHGSQTLSQALSNSCNPALATIGTRVGSANFYKYYVGFGFTERTGIDVLGEAKPSTALYHGPDMSPVSLATDSIGQTFKVTPIEMITAVSAVANNGRLMTPYIVDKQLDDQGNVVKTTAPQEKRQVISEETSKLMREMLEECVISGGGKNAYVPGYRVAGKTGTADKTEDKGDGSRGDVWVSFAGFAPAEDPQVAILVMIDEPQTAVRFASTIVAPVAQRILAATLPYMGIEPVYTEEEIANMNRTTPAVEGKELAAAESAIRAVGLEPKVVGGGSAIVKQMPEAGHPIPKGGTVVLYTDGDGGGDTVKVPQFVGMTLSQANKAAANAGLNLLITGITATGQGEAFAASQSAAFDEVVKRGTVVTVNFIYRDTED